MALRTRGSRSARKPRFRTAITCGPPILEIQVAILILLLGSFSLKSAVESFARTRLPKRTRVIDAGGSPNLPVYPLLHRRHLTRTSVASTAFSSKKIMFTLSQNRNVFFRRRCVPSNSSSLSTACTKSLITDPRAV